MTIDSAPQMADVHQMKTVCGLIFCLAAFSSASAFSSDKLNRLTETEGTFEFNVGESYHVQIIRAFAKSGPSKINLISTLSDPHTRFKADILIRADEQTSRGFYRVVLNEKEQSALLAAVNQYTASALKERTLSNSNLDDFTKSLKIWLLLKTSLTGIAIKSHRILVKELMDLFRESAVNTTVNMDAAPQLTNGIAGEAKLLVAKAIGLMSFDQLYHIYTSNLRRSCADVLDKK